MDGREAYEAVTAALETGYRHIDSAEWYENEREVGQAIRDFCKKHNVPREEIFYTSKLKLNNGYAGVRAAIKRSLDACGLGYIDLYLIHGPIGGPQARKESWQAICDVQKEDGTLKTCGISTYGVKHIREMEEYGLPMPVVHQQIDLHPFQTRQAIVHESKKHGMTMEAWAPLVRAMRFDHWAISRVAKKYNKSPAQVLLRYSVQKGYVPLPKTVSKERMVSNSDIFDFELSEIEMADFDGLDEGLVTDWDPTTVP
ncbi:NADP-dependent oxidoreductase domain-containing protein [Schizophyllum commune]